MFRLSSEALFAFREKPSAVPIGKHHPTWLKIFWLCICFVPIVIGGSIAVAYVVMFVWLDLTWPYIFPLGFMFCLMLVLVMGGIQMVRDVLAVFRKKNNFLR